MNTLDFKQLFEQSPELLVVIDTNFAIVAASDAFLKTTATVRENIVGRNAFEVFPDNPDDKTANGERIVQASFNRVIKNKTKDVLPVVKYDIPKPESEGRGFELKYWQATSSPILDENNNVKYIIHRTEDVTENKILITQLEFEKKALKLVEDSEKRYNMMLMQSPFAFAILKGKNKVIAFANDKMKGTWGKGNNVEGKPLIEVLPELEDTPFPNLLDEVYKTGIPFYANDVLAPKYTNGGQKEDVYYNFVYQPYLEVDETISGVTIIAAEVTAAVMVKKVLEAQHEVEQKALKQIADSEKQLQNIFLNTPAAIAIFEGHEHKFILANQSYEKITNRKAADLLGKRSREVFPELIGTGTFELFDNVFETGEPFTTPEYAIMLDLKNEGVLRQCYFNFSIDPLKNDSGKIYGVIVVLYEITEQIEARKKIEESDKRYNMMLMKSPFAFAVLKGKDMVITLANDSIKEMWGKGKDLEGKPLLEILPEIKGSEFPGLLDKVYTTGIPIYGDELLAPVFRNGKLEDVYFNFVYQPYLEADETISGITIIAYEVTAQVIVKKALEAQREAEKKALKLVEETNKRYYTMLMESPFAFSIMKGKEMVVSLANDLMKEFWGKGNDVEGKTLLQLLPELHDQPFPAMIDRVFTTGKPVYANEILAKLKQNHKLEDKYFNIVYQPYFEADNTISGVTTIAYDVTEMVLARKKIEESEKRFRSLVEKSPYPICIFKGKEMKMEVANEPMLKIFNVGEEAFGKPFLEILPEMKEQPFIALLLDVLENGISHYGSEQPAYFLRKNGEKETHFFNFVYQPYRENDGSATGVMVLATDVTEQVLARKKVEASEFRFHNMVYTSPSMIAIFKGEDMIIEIANDSIMESWGKGKDIIGKSLLSIMPEIIEQGFDKILSDVYKTGIPFHAYEAPVSLLRNGKLEVLHYTFVYQAQRNINGEIEGVAVIANEVTPQATLNLKVRESEGRFRQLVQQAPVAICIIRGEKYVVETVNAGMLEFWGRTEDQVLHKPIFEVLTELEGQSFEALVNGVYTTGQRFVGTELPVTLLRKGQLENAYVTFVYEPLREVDGTISGIMVLAHEITDQVNARKAIETSEKKFRLLTNTMPQKITNADAAGNVIFFNQQWLDDTGLTFEELRDWGWKKAMHPDDLELTVNNWKHSVATGDVFDMECRIQNKESGYRWHLSRAVPIRDETEKIVMWVGSNTDIHAQKEQEAILEKAVKSRTKELETLNVELENANKDLTSFTYVSSHDLQEPLRKIQNFAKVILLEEEKNLSATGKGYFLRMTQTAKRMQALIEDLLTYSRAKKGERIIETVDLNLLLNEVKIDFEEVIKEKKAIIEADLCEAKVIPFQFRQLMQNLISNSLKFSNPNLPPHIIMKSKIATGEELRESCQPESQEKLIGDKKYCHIHFTDNGIGFEPQYKERIFEVFQRLHSVEEYAGTGIGLAICRRIIENHRGIITATGKLNEGAQFEIYIPA